MRIRELLRESAQKVGRAIQHIEDLVYIDGVAGAKSALNRLRSLAQNPKQMTVKWDGSPAIMFGRDEQGRFHFADQYAKQQVSSGQELQNMLLSRGAEVTDERKQFAANMARLYDIYKTATPDNFRGFVKADLLYTQRPPQNDRGEYVFQPNVVKYFVNSRTPLGQKIGRSQSGAAIVGYSKTLGGPAESIGNIWQNLDATDHVAIFPPTHSETAPKLDTSQLDTIEQKIVGKAHAIESFIAPEAGLSDIRNIIYSYVNSQVDVAGGLQNLGNNFADWISKSTKVSQPKKEKILARVQQNPVGVSAVFTAVKDIAAAKENIIDQLEAPTLGTLGIRAELPGGQPGGEGLVSAGQDGLLKFVKRGGFTAASRAGAR